MKKQQNFFDALFYANATSTENLDFHLAPNEFKVLLKLIHYSNDQVNITWKSTEISKHISMPVGAIDKAIQRLKQKGYINTSTYNTDTFTKHRTIFINWDRIEYVDDLYNKSLGSIESEIKNEIETIQSSILSELIPEVQVEEKVSEIEDNEINDSSAIKLQDLILTDVRELTEFKSKYNCYIPKVLLEYMYLVEGKTGLENKLKKIYNQTDFNLELLSILKEQHNRQIFV